MIQQEIAHAMAIQSVDDVSRGQPRQLLHDFHPSHARFHERLPDSANTTLPSRAFAAASTSSRSQSLRHSVCLWFDVKSAQASFWYSGL
jgi:hypothetical protein